MFQSPVVSETPVDTNDNPVQKDMMAKKEIKNKKVTHLEPDFYINLQKSNLQNKSTQQKTPKPILKKTNENGNSFRANKKLGQNYAINMCMCSQRRAKKKLLNIEIDAEAKDNKQSKLIVPTSSVKQTKPINSNLQSQSKPNRSKPCNGVCFHKTPSNTSIDKLLETLVKWNKDHSSSENEKEFCNLLPGSCPKQIENVKQRKDEVNKLQSINNIGKRSSPPKKITAHIEGSQSQSDNYKSLETKIRPSHDINIEKSAIVMSSVPKTSSVKSKESEQPLLKDDEGGVLSPTETSQLNNTEKQENFQSRSFNDDSVINEKITDGINKNKNVKPFDIKIDVPELPSKDTDVIPPTESKYMGEINLDKSVEEVCKCSKCNNWTASMEVLLPCQCKTTHAKISMKDQSGDQDKQAELIGTKIEQMYYERFSGNKQINGDNVPIGDTKIDADNESIKMQQDSKTKNPSDSYDIKFLGVTLTDVSSQNQENTNKQYIVGEKKGAANNNKHIIMNRELKSKDPIIMTLETKEEAGDQRDTQSGEDTLLCDCELKPNYKFSIKTKKGTSKIYDKSNITEEHKNCIKSVFQNQQANEDRGLQNFDVDQKQEGPCVCCSYKNVDGSEDLEENTFHLLEEHIKDKLKEFKQTSCNDTCIPSEEEEKLFTAILSRVKKVITEGTNKIACKCSKEEKTSQGSWNRAYGLLQEYLKTKIKRIQCSCVLAEENNDTILPDVLDKVFHLIEYDFKRLKDICGCKKDSEPRNSRVIFKEELPERDEKFQNGLNTNAINGNVPKYAPTFKKKKENNSPDYEMFLNNVQNSEAQQNLILDKDSTLDNDDKLLEIQENKPSTIKTNYQNCNQPYAGFDCICTNFECSANDFPNNSKETVNLFFAKPVHDTTIGGKRGPILNTTNVQESPPDQVKESSKNLNKETEPLVKEASKADKITDANLLKDTYTQLNSINKKATTSSECTGCSYTHTTTPPPFGGGSLPYFGYTIDCSCDATLSPRHSTKSVLRDNRNDKDNIIKKSSPEEKVPHNYDCNDKKGILMDKIICQTQSLSEMVNGDLFLHKILNNQFSNMKNLKDRETEVSNCDADGIILKDSREYNLTMAHNRTNTSDDTASLVSDSSPHGWCGSHMCHHGVSQSDQLSQSYPDDFEIAVDARNGNASSSQYQENCSCDMVPICHVKMLVENIENKLVAANCTCDLLIPQVCPIHSMR